MPHRHPHPPPADWYTWLRRAGLDPPAALECAALLRRQELEPDDAPDFDHDLLRTAGVAVAKHRLQILRLARDEARVPTPLAMLRGLVSAAAGRVASWCRLPGNGPTSFKPGPAFVPPTPTVPLPVKACWGARGSERWTGDGGRRGVVAGLLRPTSRRMLKLAGGGRAKVASAGTPPPRPLPLPFPRAPLPAMQGCDRKTENGSGSLVVAGAPSDSASDEQEVGWDALFRDMKPT